MAFNSVESVLTPRAGADLPNFSPGTALLGGGTWLYSEPQPDAHQLVDIEALGWENLRVDAQGLPLNCSTLPPLMSASVLWASFQRRV
jgi:hypothetical protein